MHGWSVILNLSMQANYLHHFCSPSSKPAYSFHCQAKKHARCPISSVVVSPLNCKSTLHDGNKPLLPHLPWVYLIDSVCNCIYSWRIKCDCVHFLYVVFTESLLMVITEYKWRPGQPLSQITRATNTFYCLLLCVACMQLPPDTVECVCVFFIS